MLKIRVLTLIITLVLLSTVAVSCGTPAGEQEGSLSRTMKIYGDKLFYFDGFTVVYKNLDNPSSDVYPLCSDSLCSHDNASCPLYLGMQVYLMAIDKKESEKNDGYPVLYISSLWCESIGENIDGYRIIRYDSKTNTSKTIISKIANPINSFYVYGEYIFYTSNDGDNGYNIYVIKKDGSRKIALDNPEQNSYALVGAYGQFIYYTDFLGNLYFSDFKLNQKTFVKQTKSIFGACYICDGYLYYADDISIVDRMGNTDVYNCNIYRIALNTEVTEAPAEPVLENVFFDGTPYIFKGQDIFYYCIPDYKYVGQGFYYDLNDEKQNIDIYYNGSDSIYSFNPKNGETNLVFKNNGYNFQIYYDASEKYIIYSMYKVNEDLSVPYGPVHELFCYNIKTKDFYTIK